MITLKLARGDNYESVPLRLPTTPGEVDEVFAALDAASRDAGEVQIIGVDSGVPSLAKHLKGAGLTDPDAFDKLNRLAEKIDGMDERQRDIFSGALDAESAGSLDDVLRVSDSLEAYTFVPNVRSDEELGRYVVVAGQLHGDRRFPEEAWPYLDFAKIGAEYFAGHGGVFIAKFLPLSCPPGAHFHNPPAGGGFPRRRGRTGYHQPVYGQRDHPSAFHTGIR